MDMAQEMLSAWNYRMKMFIRILWIAMLFACLGIGGCSSTTVLHPAAPLAIAQSNQKVAGSDYRIVAGDSLEIRFIHTPDLNNIVTVRPDGKISLPMISEIRAGGMTTVELAEAVRTAYAGQLKRPDATINIKTFSSQRIFIGGEVQRPGMQALVGPVSVLQAIMAADGIKDTGNDREIIIVRRGDHDQRLVYSIDITQVLSGKDPSQDILLQPFDVVVVPRSGIANLNTWIDMYIRKNLPINTGFSYTINGGGSGNR